jgi:multidrug efflux pump subunit AcrA (membrane-fusion protein)
MTEEKVKKRGWVKNAAIIFLSIMLVLTFFSNTIMNRSLPEVAAQYVSSGTITTKIRGSGTVEANASYEVKISQSRKVESVMVKVGDPVETGDTLFLLADTQSDELKQAQDTLEELNLSYQKAVINAADTDYAKENRNIQLAREELAEAEAELGQNRVTDAQIKTAENAVEVAKNAVKTAEEKVTKCENQVADAEAALNSAGSGGSVDTSTIQSNLDAAKRNLTTLQLTHQAAWSALKTEAEARAQAAGGGATAEDYMGVVALENAAEGSAHHDWYVAYTAITAAQDEVNKYQLQLDSAQSAGNNYDYYSGELSSARSELTKANKKLAEAKADQAELEEKLAELKSQKEKYDAAEDDVKAKQKALEDLLFDFSEQQKADGKEAAIYELDLQKMRSDLADQQQLVSKLQSEAVGTEIKADVYGVVKSINVTAGNTTTPDQAVAVIEVVDRGYSVSFAVTTEQSQKVSIGDPADVTNAYWGSNITATLATIKNDPNNPGKGKLLVFDVGGDVESGSSLSLSIGQRSANYDLIVPNSAVRSDSNGSFVLIVQTKSSPLGNRFVAERVDVKVLATDDINTAVSGGLNSNSDMVITTSAKPIEPGMLVRMPDN